MYKKKKLKEKRKEKSLKNMDSISSTGKFLSSNGQNQIGVLA